MSATLDMHLLYTYFARDFQCDILEVGGRMYPIEDTYLDDDIENYVQESVTKAIEIHQSGEIGDILVFLTGQDEIDLALADLNQKLDQDESYIGLPLHGKLSKEENARIFEKMPNIRKIIFSTNVAETSVTIDGIKHVIESGMVKEKMWDEKRKMQVLKIGEITKSSVKQRRGRAGRTSAGKCYHLYTVETYEAMDTCSRAEILCTQPTIAILKLKHLNINNIESFEWLESPSDSSLHEAYQTLIWLNAVDSQGKLTNLGRNMARLDIDPKLTVMLYKGQELNCLSYTLILAGMLTVSQNIWWSSKDQKSKDIATQTRAQLSHESGDHITLINVYLKWNRFCAKNKNKKQQYEWCKTNSLSGKALQMAHDFIREKSRQMEHEVELSNTEEEELNNDLIYRLLQCITAGHFLNLAISNGPLRAGYQVISAFSPMTIEPVIARVFRTSTLCLNDQMPKYILFNELLNINETNYITILSSIDLNWLKSVSQQWYTTINGANLHTISYESYTIKNVGTTLLRAIVGKRNCNLNKFEELTQAIIDVDYKQAKITIWSRQTNLENAKKIVEKMVETEKQKLLIEAEEIQVIGRTRILMGAGSVSQMILVEDEFIRIIITKLPINITEERIRDLCEPFGQSKS
jgi:ATP-dependent RNA helicase DHX8/PRP22